MNKDRNVMFSLLLVIFIDMLGIGIIIPLLGSVFMDSSTGIFSANTPLYIKSIMYGVMMGLYPLGQFFGAPLLGALSDHYGRKKLLILSIAGSAIGYVLFGIGIIYQNIYLLVFSRLLDGFTGGNISIAMSSIADISDEKSKAKNFGLIGMAFGVGMVIGPFIGSRLSDSNIVSWFSYSTPFFITAMIASVNIVLLLFVYKETLKTRIHTKISMLTGFRNIRKAWHMPNLKIMFITLFLIVCGFNFYTQFLQLFLIEKFSYNLTQIGNFYAFLGLCIAIAQGTTTRIFSKYFRSEQILKVTIFCMAGLILCMSIPKNPLYLYFITPFLAVSNAFTFPNSSAIVSNLSAKDSQGEILGISQSVQALAQVIPPVIAGFAISINYNLPIYISSTLIFIAWIVFTLLFNKKDKHVFKEV